MEAELPEVKQEDVKATLDNGVLASQGERKEEEKGRKMHRTERSYGHFVKSFTLPDLVDDTQVNAEFREDVLHPQLSKSEKVKPKAIEIKMA